MMTDVVVILAVLVVLGFVLLPSVMPRRENRGSGGPHCTANIKQSALVYILWTMDSEKMDLPFRVPYENGGLKDPARSLIQIAQIGEFDSTLRSNAWLQFLFLYKGLQDPKVLLCPEDMKQNKERKPATSWGKEEGGLAAPGMQNNSISYGINLDVGFRLESGSLDPESSQAHVLLTERHMEYDTVNSACSANVGLTKVVKVNRQLGTNASVRVGWKEDRPKIHKKYGSVALLDGSVHQVNARQLQTLLEQADEKGELHFIYP